jgi:hypothetical protein
MIAKKATDNDNHDKKVIDRYYEQWKVLCDETRAAVLALCAKRQTFSDVNSVPEDSDDSDTPGNSVIQRVL